VVENVREVRAAQADAQTEIGVTEAGNHTEKPKRRKSNG
jgi:hypothetical protein